MDEGYTARGGWVPPDPHPDMSYDLGSLVVIRPTGERGSIEGRAQFLKDEDQYLVVYVDSQKCQQVRWLPRHLLLLTD